MEAALQQTPKMMPGSSTGKTYFAFAKKGNVALGVKPQGIIRGEMFDVPGTTYFMARVRSAPTVGWYEEAESTVVKLEKPPENLWDAWPAITWEKKNGTRASTTIGVFLRGVFSKDVAELEKLLEQLQGGKMTNAMADYLIGIAGVEHMIVTNRELHLWLESQFKPIIDSLVERVEKAKKLEAEMTAQIGVFGMQASILKKVYSSTAEADEEKPEDENLTQDVPDGEVPEDPDDGVDESNDD